MNKEFIDLLISLDVLEIRERGKWSKLKEKLKENEQKTLEKRRGNFDFNEDKLFDKFKQNSWIQAICDVGMTCKLPYSFLNSIGFSYLVFELVTVPHRQSYFNRCTEYLRGIIFDPKLGPFLFQPPAAPIADRLHHVTGTAPKDVVYVTLEEQSNLFSLYRELSISLFARHLQLTSDPSIEVVLPHMLAIFSTAHAATATQMLSFFKKLKNKDDLLIIEQCQRWYEQNKMTFVHQPKDLNFDSVSLCVYLLNQDQLEELSIFFYFRIEAQIKKLKSNRNKNYDPKTESTIGRLRQMISEIKSWKKA